MINYHFAKCPKSSEFFYLLELAQQSKEDGDEGSDAAAGGGDSPDPESLRADEYEKLARLCLEKKQ